jgi:hypothetical protein
VLTSHESSAEEEDVSEYNRDDVRMLCPDASRLRSEGKICEKYELPFCERVGQSRDSGVAAGD